MAIEEAEKLVKERQAGSFFADTLQVFDRLKMKKHVAGMKKRQVAFKKL